MRACAPCTPQAPTWRRTNGRKSADIRETGGELADEGGVLTCVENQPQARAAH